MCVCAVISSVCVCYLLFKSRATVDGVVHVHCIRFIVYAHGTRCDVEYCVQLFIHICYKLNFRLRPMPMNRTDVNADDMTDKI